MDIVAVKMANNYTDKKAMKAGVSYLHTQGTASSEWRVAHSLGRKVVSAALVNEKGDAILGEPEYYSENLLIVRFSKPVKGRAYIT